MTEKAPEPGETPEASETPAVEAPAAPEPLPFWQRPYVERYLAPLVLPLFAVVVLVAYILNISRLFLSGHGHIPVIVGTVITLIILVGAVMTSGSSGRAKQSSLTLVGVGFIVLIMGSGWLVLGHAAEKKEAASTIPADVTAKVQEKVTAAPGGALAFAPPELTAKTGLVTFDVNFAAGGHTFAFHQPETLFAELNGATAGAQKGTAFFPAPGDYTYFCSIPGHEAAGMKGVVHVTGSPQTLAEAEAAAGVTPTK